MRPTQLDVVEEPAGSTLFVSVAGELDMNTVEALHSRLSGQPRGEFTAVTLDLGGVVFMDSSALKFLIELHDCAVQEGWQLTLLKPRHEAATLVLEATGADAALPFGASGP